MIACRPKNDSIYSTILTKCTTIRQTDGHCTKARVRTPCSKNDINNTFRDLNYLTRSEDIEVNDGSTNDRFQ